MATDDFIQAAQAAGESEEEAWTRYSKQIGHRPRLEFSSCWLFWKSAIGHAIIDNPDLVA